MRVLILVNGDPPSARFLRQLMARHDLLIATDGAAHRAATLGATPDIICGDFDSIDLDAARSEFPRAEFVATPDQDLADIEKALLLARTRGATAMTVTGAAGGRIDHTLGNFSLLLRYHSEIPLAIVDDRSEVRAISGSDSAAGMWIVKTTPGDTISLVSLHGTARATVSGVRWPLEDHRLATGTNGISNVAIGERVVVEVRGGALIACHLIT